MRDTGGLPWVEEYRGRILDSHAHIGSDQRFLLRLGADRLIELMDLFGIKVACVSSILSLVYDYREGNRHVASALVRHPERLVGLVSVNPLYGDEALSELDRCMRGGFRGIKFHPFYFGIEPTHRLSMEIWEYASRNGVPAMIHSYDGGMEVARLADLFPELTIVAYHMGGVRWREALKSLKRRDNVYVEISSSVAECGMIEAAVEELGSERVLYGSDVPYNDPSVSLGKVAGADISGEDKERILCENLSKVLRL